jgi:uncharacterized protein DUF1194
MEAWMRGRKLIFIMATGIVILGALGAGLAAPTPGRSGSAEALIMASSGAVAVDVELVLSTDISYSMDYDELKLQRDGYVEAIQSAEFLSALKQGTHGKVAVTLVEWAGENDQRVVVPWRLIDGAETARAVAAEMAAAPVRRAFRTSISGALIFSAKLFEGNGFAGIRRVIDVSGDGTNNQGPLIVPTRDDVVAKGIVINGLPIMLKEPQPNSIDIKDLDIYYEDCVIGGPGAFVVPMRELEKFKDAIRTKLVMEVAGREPPARVVPAAAAAPRISCTIGEQMWQRRFGNGLDFR